MHAVIIKKISYQYKLC